MTSNDVHLVDRCETGAVLKNYWPGGRFYTLVSGINDLMYVEIKKEYMPKCFLHMQYLRHWLYLQGLYVIYIERSLQSTFSFHSFNRIHAVADKDATIGGGATRGGWTRQWGGGWGGGSVRDRLTQLLFGRFFLN